MTQWAGRVFSEPPYVTRQQAVQPQNSELLRLLYQKIMEEHTSGPPVVRGKAERGSWEDAQSGVGGGSFTGLRMPWVHLLGETFLGSIIDQRQRLDQSRSEPEPRTVGRFPPSRQRSHALWETGEFPICKAWKTHDDYSVGPESGRDLITSPPQLTRLATLPVPPAHPVLFFYF